MDYCGARALYGAPLGGYLGKGKNVKIISALR
jgi:hypothetical protein